MPESLATEYLPKQIITATRYWALSVLYYQDKTQIGFDRVLRAMCMYKPSEPAVAVGHILKRCLELQATSIALVVNQSHNEHSAADFMDDVGGPLAALGVAVVCVYLINPREVVVHKMARHHRLAYRNGRVYCHKL